MPDVQLIYDASEWFYYHTETKAQKLDKNCTHKNGKRAFRGSDVQGLSESGVSVSKYLNKR